jgi:hypothetical protein
MCLATGPFEFGVIDHLVIRDRRKFVTGCGVGHQSAFGVHVLTHDAHSAGVIQHLRADITAALHKAHNERVMGLAAEVGRPLRFAGSREFGFVSLYNLASTTQRADIATGSHPKSDTVAEVPSRFHTTAKDALKLAGADAFLAAAKQVDGLKPKPQGEMAILENRSNADREGLPADVALAQADAGRLALKAADLGLIGVLAVRANGAIRPKLSLYVSKGGFLVVKPGIGKDRLGNGLAPMAHTEPNSIGYVK